MRQGDRDMSEMAIKVMNEHSFNEQSLHNLGDLDEWYSLNNKDSLVFCGQNTSAYIYTHALVGGRKIFKLMNSSH